MSPPTITETATVNISPAVVQQAADWLSRLWSSEAGPEEERACADWRAQKPEHELAWQRLQQIGTRFDAVPTAIGQGTLRAPHSQTRNNARRNVLRMLGWGIATGGAVGVTRESQLWHYNTADYSTGTGEWQQVRLADGTQLILNTATAIDIAFDEHERRIRLNAGEIYITTAPDTASPARPFLVETRDGTIRALGTRYSVHKLDDKTQVSVYEHAVEISPRHSDRKVRLDAGLQASLTPAAVTTPTPLETAAPAWTQRRLVAERMRLDDFLTEISRYRHGVLRCDPSIADLRLTGIFPLDDTDRALLSLADGLPVKLDWTTRYWLTVRPRGES